MEWIRITPKNLETEHICCAIAGNRDCGVAAKKAWLKERLKEGLVHSVFCGKEKEAFRHRKRIFKASGLCYSG